jgi:hypothetical protein
VGLGGLGRGSSLFVRLIHISQTVHEAQVPKL